MTDPIPVYPADSRTDAEAREAWGPREPLSSYAEWRAEGISPYAVQTICGSMRYYDLMLRVAERATSVGVIILMPFVSDYTGGMTPDDRKRMLDDMHRAKIDMSGAIIVVGSHIGESTAGEIAYAEQAGKQVIYVERRA